METVLSTDVREDISIINRSEEEGKMSIAEYITLTGGEVVDEFRGILINANSVVTKEEVIEAIKNYKLAVAVNPDDVESHFKLGMSYLLLKDRRSALKEYSILKKLLPRIADELLQKWNVKTPWSYR